MLDETHRSDEEQPGEDQVGNETRKAEKLRPSFIRRVWNWFVRAVVGIFFLIVAYLLLCLIGLIPVNNDFAEADPKAAGSVRIFVRSSGVHSDVVMPIKTGVIDWRDYFPRSEFKSNTMLLSHVAVGWGDRGFYLETPTWDDLTLRTSAKAILLPSDSVMHVTMTRAKESETCRSVVITEKQYRRLVGYVVASFRKQEIDGDPDDAAANQWSAIPIDLEYSYSWNDRFYEANGSYHAFNTCNCWVGRAIRRTGIQAAWFTPLPGSVLVHWPESKP